MKKYIIVSSNLSGSRTTLAQAAEIAKKIENSCILLVTAVKNDDESRKSNENHAFAIAWMEKNFPSIEVVSLVVKGEVQQVISDIADEYDAQYAFLKSHVSQGAMEKMMSNPVIDIIGETDVPFLVLQEGHVPKPDGFKKIIVTISARVKSKQKIEVIAKMAKEFNSEIFLYYGLETDDWAKHHLDGNVSFIKKYLDKKEIKHQEYNAQIFSDNVEQYKNDLLEYSNKVGADLISIMNFQRSFHLLSFPANNFENQLIINKYKIPILIINPKQIGIYGPVSFAI